MKTSSADVLSRAVKHYFFEELVMLLTAAWASLTEIEPGFEAGVMTKRPVAALRPSTRALPCLSDLLLALFGRVPIFGNVHLSPPTRKVGRTAILDAAQG